ncbi:MAG: hypothetical protein ACERJ1_05270 [Halodesulfovibrio sp.]|uniref:hypothetical protein n=1 Tax=Halodesulfovibrio sp. TaxID=1912772 RepID=UPI00359CBD07
MSRNKKRKINAGRNSTTTSYLKDLYHVKFSDEILLGRVKRLERVTDIEYIVSKIPSSIKHKVFFENPFPQRIEEVGKKVSIPFKDLKEVLTWYYITIKEYRTQIYGYSKFKFAYEKCFLKGKYECCMKLLSKCEQRYGYSLWGIENKFLCIEYLEGLEGNKHYLEYLSEKEISVHFSIIAELCSQKSEKKQTSRKYLDFFKSYVLQYESAGLTSFIDFLASGYAINLPRVCSPLNVLNTGQMFSLVDRYNFYLNVIKDDVFLSKNQTEEHLSLIRNTLQMLPSRDVQNVLNAVRSPQDWEYAHCNSKYLDLIEMLVDGDAVSAECVAKELLYRCPNTLEPYEFSSCFVEEGEWQNMPLQNGLQRVVNTSRNIEGDGLTSLIESEKICDTLSSFSLSRQVKAYQKKVLGNELLTSSDAVIAGYSYLPNLNILFLKRFDEKKQLDLIKDYPQVHRFFKYVLNGNDSNEASVYCMQYRAYYLLQNSCYTEARLTFNKLSKRNNQFGSGMLAMLGLFSTLVAEDKLSSATKFLIRSYLKYKSYQFLRLTNDLASRLKVAKKDPANKLIEAAIAVTLAMDNTTQRHIACNRFLRGYNINRPSDLFKKNDGLSREAYVFFLESVATMDVLYKSYHFNSTDEVENERIVILKELLLVNPKEKEKYFDELNDILKENMIRRGMRHVHESKIELNLDKLSERIVEEIEDSFSRYQDIREKDIKSRHVATSDLNRFMLRVREVAHWSVAFTAFYELFMTILKIFLNDKESGLDTMLGVRIRHGTLLGALTSPFIKQHLLVSYDKEKGTYEETDTWNRALKLNEGSLSQVYEALVGFSQKINHIASEVRDKWIQITIDPQSSSCDGGTAYFSYQFSMPELHALFDEIPYSSTQEFVKGILNVLMDRTQACLFEVKRKIRGELQIKMLDELNILEERVEQVLKDERKFPLINAIIKSRTDVQRAIVNIANWFSVSHSQSIYSFELPLAAQTALKIIENIHGDELEVQFDSAQVDAINLDGRYFSHFVDIFLILFDNAITRSGVSRSCLLIRTSFSCYESRVVLSITNNLEKDCDYQAIRMRVDDILDKIETGKAGDKHRTEGGSGIIKIDKIFSHNLNIFFSQNYYVSDLCEFEVQIDFDFKGLLSCEC